MRTRVWQGVAVSVLGIALGLVIAEAIARRMLPQPPFYDFIMQYPSDTPKYRLDSQLGYVPRFGDVAVSKGYGYDFFGVNVDESIRLDHGAPRLLFLGDSVTRAGRIIHGLDEAYAGNHWQFLNAGVEGYNVIQEVDYFLRYASKSIPDRIVLTIHNNDLTYFPMTYLISPDEIFWYFPAEPPLLFHRELFGKSRLYQEFVTWEYIRLQRKVHEEHALPEKTRESLRALRDWANAHHVRLQALILPILRPYSEWSAEEKESRDTALALTKELGIESFDLLPPLEKALRDGQVVKEGAESDFWHPNFISGGYFARYLKEKGLFADLPLSLPRR